jgi:hypothetical protein
MHRVRLFNARKKKNFCVCWIRRGKFHAGIIELIVSRLLLGREMEKFVSFSLRANSVSDCKCGLNCSINKAGKRREKESRARRI